MTAETFRSRQYPKGQILKITDYEGKSATVKLGKHLGSTLYEVKLLKLISSPSILGYTKINATFTMDVAKVKTVTKVKATKKKKK